MLNPRQTKTESRRIEHSSRREIGAEMAKTRLQDTYQDLHLDSGSIRQHCSRVDDGGVLAGIFFQGESGGELAELDCRMGTRIGGFARNSGLLV